MIVNIIGNEKTHVTFSFYVESDSSNLYFIFVYKLCDNFD